MTENRKTAVYIRLSIPIKGRANIIELMLKLKKVM